MNVTGLALTAKHFGLQPKCRRPRMSNKSKDLNNTEKTFGFNFDFVLTKNKSFLAFLARCKPVPEGDASWR
jgi:hypothetical protein